MGRLTFEQEVEAHLREIADRARPLIEARVRASRAAWDRDHPASRVCLLCKRPHKHPRLVIERTQHGDRRRWASESCIRRRMGLAPNAPLGSVVQVIR